MEPTDPNVQIAAAGMGLVGAIIYFGVIVFILAAMWKVFTKAGKPGWAIIIPIYNIIVMLEIIGKPIWWILLFLVPLVNVVMLFVVYISLAKVFGKGTGFGLGLVFLSPIFIPILGFGSAQYQGAQAA